MAISNGFPIATAPTMDLLLKKLQEASLSSGISVSNVQIVDGAIVPKSPVKPNRKRNLLLALVIGLFGFMTGDPRWAVRGLVLAVLGVILFVAASRRGPRSTPPSAS